MFCTYCRTSLSVSCHTTVVLGRAGEGVLLNQDLGDRHGREGTYLQVVKAVGSVDPVTPDGFLGICLMA